MFSDKITKENMLNVQDMLEQEYNLAYGIQPPRKRSDAIPDTIKRLRYSAR